MKMSYGVMKSNVPLKQGYLYIKRERNSDRVTTRALSKPWQRAYFILYREPIFFEEYRDASLKSRKHIHCFTVIKHVGRIRTSRSKQHAFEIIDERISLLLACENQILLDEWIKVFVEVMNKRKLQSKIGPESGIREEFTCPVDIVETTLSGINDLHGEYFAVISRTRMFLLDPEDYGEVLSWPLGHITIHNCQPNQNRILLVMGKNCHFGSGKLILATKEYAQIMTVLNNLKVERRKLLSSTLSSPEVSPIRNIHTPQYKHLMSGSTTRVFKEEDENIQETKEYGPNNTSGKINLERIKSCPNLPGSCPTPLNRCPSLQASRENLFVRSGTKEVVVKKPTLIRSPGWTTSAFPEISPEGGYIQPNEMPSSEQEHNKELLLGCNRIGVDNNSVIDRTPSIIESEVSSSPYLHLIDDDGNASVEQKILSDTTLSTEELRDAILDELSDPQKHVNDQRKLIPTVPSIEPSVKQDSERRRVSEPIKKSVIECVRQKPRHTSADLPSDARRQSSPRLSPKPTSVSLPKQRSMQPVNFFENMAKTVLIQQKHPFQKGDNMIPSLLPNSISLPVPKNRKSINSRPNSRDMDSVSVSVGLDQPPQIPIRESPELLQRAQHDLTITIRKETKGCHNTINDLSGNLSTITVQSSRTYTPEAPPLPPKSKTLTLTKSGTLSDTIEESGGDTSRRSSYGEDSWQSADDNNESEKDSTTPPAVPKRNYNTRNLVKQQKINPSENNLFSINEIGKKPKRPSPLASKPPMSKSLDSLSFVPSNHLPFPEEDEKDESSPPPHRKLSSSNPPNSILLDGEGKDFPSISVTRLNETTPEEVNDE